MSRGIDVADMECSSAMFLMERSGFRAIFFHMVLITDFLHTERGKPQA